MTVKSTTTVIAQGCRSGSCSLHVHSYGMEPSLADYITGLNAAQARLVTEARELFARTVDIVGDFTPMVEGPYGRKNRTGTGGLCAYTVSIQETGHGNSYDLRHHILPHWVYYNDDNDQQLAGYVHETKAGPAARKYNTANHQLSSVDILFDNVDDALRFIAIAHLKSA